MSLKTLSCGCDVVRNLQCLLESHALRERINTFATGAWSTASFKRGYTHSRAGGRQ